MRLVFKSGEQKKFLDNATKSLELSKTAFSNWLGVSKTTLYNYLAEKYYLPERFATKIFDETSINYKTEILRKTQYSFVVRPIEMPDILNPKFAEFIGIILGDGHIGKLNSEISITCNLLLDFNYMKFFVYPMIVDLFNIKPYEYIRNDNNIIRFKFYNKSIHNFFTNNLNLPKGKKVDSERLEIPKIYFTNKECLCSCLRGLFDTDGGINRHRERDPMIEIDSYNKQLRDSIHRALLSLDIRATVSGRKVYIYAKKDIHKFFKSVGSNNPRNSVRYDIWKKTGKIPRVKEIQDKCSCSLMARTRN